MVQAFVKADKRGSRLVLGDGDTVDEAQATGRWLATTDAVEVRR